MFSSLFFNSSLWLWSFFAQAMPGGAPSGAPAVAASGAPVAPAAAASAAPAAAASGAPVSNIVGSLPQAPIQAGHSAFVTVFLLIYFVICVALIICVLFQTTKSEGLSGVIGGTSTSSLFRGKKSAEENLSQWTNRLAVAFIACSLALWILMSKK